MRAVLSTISKFHTFEVARQLERWGALAHLFTGRPRWKLKGEDLPPKKVSTFSPLQTIFEGLGKLGIKQYPFKRELNWQCHQTFDRYVARHLSDCDIFHALSYCGLRSGQVAQTRGGKWICDAVNSHLVYQDEILAAEYDRLGLFYQRQDPRLLDYAVESYKQSDLITVPSMFVKNSFIAKGIPTEKIALLPYGVNLESFQRIETIPGQEFTILYVGQLSVRKGIKDLVTAFQLASLPHSKLLLIGPILPETTQLVSGVKDSIEILGVKPKSQLAHYYSRADVMVFPSIEDGFGYVIGEAMACGCPVIASEHTGGPDFITEGENGFVVPIRSPEVIAEKLVWLYEHPEAKVQMRQAAVTRVEKIGGWDSYGEQLLQVYQRLFQAGQDISLC